MAENERICRWCAWYRPDTRYLGAVGICDVDGSCTDVTRSCDTFAKGEQEWLQGGKVE